MDIIEKNLDTIEKAFTTGDLATGGLLNSAQSNQFLRDIVKDTVMVKECRVIPMNTPKRLIDKIGFTGRISQAATEAAAPGSVSEPTTDKVELSTVEFIAAVDVSYSTLEDNIERASLEQTIMEMIAEQVGLDIEELAIRGDTNTGGGDLFLDALDGWFKLAGHTVNHSNAVYSFLTALKNIHAHLPKKYLKNKGAWRFYMDEDLVSIHQDEVMAGKYNTGDTMWIETDKDKSMGYKGIKLVGVPQMQLAQGTTGSPAVATSSILFANPKNLCLGIQRKVTVETWRNRRSRVLEITVTYRIDYKIEETDAVIKLTNVKHALT